MSERAEYLRQCEEREKKEREAKIDSAWDKLQFGVKYKGWDFSNLNFDNAKSIQAKLALMAFTMIEETRPEKLWVFLTGPRGTGKTALMAAACRDLIKIGRGVRKFKASEIVERIQTESKNESKPTIDIIRSMLRCSVLFIDDFGIADLTDSTRRIWFDIFDECAANQKPLLVISSNHGASFLAEEIDKSKDGRVKDRFRENAISLTMFGESHRKSTNKPETALNGKGE